MNCPLCNGVLSSNMRANANPDFYYIECETCALNLGPHDTEQEALASLNRLRIALA